MNIIKKMTILNGLMILLFSTSVSAKSGQIKIVDENWDKNDWNMLSENCISCSEGYLKIDTASVKSNVGVYSNSLPNAGIYPRFPVSDKFELEAKIAVEDFYEGSVGASYTAMIYTVSEGYDLSIYLAPDGVYANTKSGITMVYEKEIGNGAHIYKAAADKGKCTLYVDSQEAASFDMAQSTDAEDIGILAKGTKTDSIKFNVDYLKITRITDMPVLCDYCKDDTVVKQLDNVEFKTYESNFFSGKTQFDLIDCEKDGSLIYEVPEGTQINDFLISFRQMPQNQGIVGVYLSKDGAGWNMANTDYKWSYANGGHRKITYPKEKISEPGYKYIKVILGCGDTNGGRGTEVSPALMGIALFYDTPKFEKAMVLDKKITDGSIIGAKNEGIDLYFTSSINQNSAKDNISLFNGKSNVECEITVSSLVVTVKPENGFDYNCNYTLKINNGLLDSSNSKIENLPQEISFSTTNGDYIFSNVKFADKSSCCVSADITNCDNEDNSVTLMMLGYKEGLLFGYEYKTTDIKSGETKTVTTDATDFSGCDKIVAMLWDNPENMLPLAKPVVMQ